jgi:hypothetical protein
VLQSTAGIFPRETARRIDVLIAKLGDVDERFRIAESKKRLTVQPSMPGRIQQRQEQLDKATERAGRLQQHAAEQYDVARQVTEKYKNEAEKPWYKR